MPSRPEWILALAGCCLILLQFCIVREVTALLRGTEVVILLVMVAYLGGYSVGYGVAGWLSLGSVRKLALGTWLLHLTLPFSLRYLGGFLWQRAGEMSIVASLFVTAFALSSFYSLLLPRFIDQAADGKQSLVRYYFFELVGAATGVLALSLVGSASWAVPVLYQAALAGLLILLCEQSFKWCTLAGVAGYALLYSTAEHESLNYRFATIHGFKGPAVLYSVNSLYQKVDIVRSRNGRRYVYLSGRENYGSPSLSEFNVFLSKLPAQLVHAQNALVVGSGSMESVKHVSRLAQHVTTVELDPAVITGSRRYLSDVNHLERIKNWTLVINDAKQFLAHTRQSFDLIIMDVPSPTTIQVGLLHSVEFYQLAKKRLTPHGVLSVSLSGRFPNPNQIPQTVAAALVEVFEDVVVFAPRDSGFSFALASRSFPFTMGALREAGAKVQACPRPRGLDIVDQPRLSKVIGGNPPLSFDHMSSTVRWSWDEISRRYLSREQR